MCKDTGYILAYRYIVQLSTINLGDSSAVVDRVKPHY
jgi:hypothetical protein